MVQDGRCRRVLGVAGADARTRGGILTRRPCRTPRRTVRRAKARSSSGCESRPAKVAPAGSNRSSRPGSEAAGKHSGAEGHLGWLDEYAGYNVSKRRAGLEKGNVEADPPVCRGRPPSLGKRAMRAPRDSAGVVTMACIEGEGWCNTGRLPRWPIARPTGLPRGIGRAEGAAERSVVPMKSGNADGGKGRAPVKPARSKQCKSAASKV